MIDLSETDRDSHSIDKERDGLVILTAKEIPGW